jgi:hypothetical protein
LVFLPLFFAFEQLHPLADLLRARTFCTSICEEGGRHSSPESGDPVRDAHGPFLTSPAAFARHAGQQKGEFWVVVPKGLRPTAEARLGDLDLEANVWELEV